MSVFLKHEPCPECRRKGWDRKGNNLGRWTDHAYCFSCGYREGTDVKGHFTRFKNNEGHTVELPLAATVLPDDAHSVLRQDAMIWLKSYGISDEDIDTHGMLWSERKELLIFPFSGPQNELMAWQGRYFGKNPDYPKYVTYGIRQDLFHYVGVDKKHLPHGRENTVVLVEDLISAIKVGRTQLSMPLFSSDANKYQLHHIAQRLDHVVIWLDPDKWEQAIKLSKRAESFFKTVNIVLSDKDPKCYTNQEIANFLS